MELLHNTPRVVSDGPFINCLYPSTALLPEVCWLLLFAVCYGYSSDYGQNTYIWMDLVTIIDYKFVI